MSKRKASDKLAFNAGKKKCSTKFKPGWLRVTVETELPTSSRKQTTKLGDIFSFCECKNDVICQICQKAGAVSRFANGK